MGNKEKHILSKKRFYRSKQKHMMEVVKKKNLLEISFAADESSGILLHEDWLDTMNLDAVELINEIMIRPEIWMAKHPANKNKWKIIRKWEEMKNSKFPQYQVDDLKKRWKNIKDQYRKELKKLPQVRPGVPAENFTSNWKYFEYMTFLKDEMVIKDPVDVDTQETEPDQMVLGESSSGSSQSQVLITHPEYRIMEISEIKTEEESPVPLRPHSDEEAPEVEQSLIHSHAKKNTNQAPKEMREELLKIEQRKLSILESEIARSTAFMKSDNYQFLMSILPEMEKLPSVHKMRLRTKISQAVLDEVTLYEEQKINSLDLRSITDNSVDVDIKEEPINMYD